MVFSALMRELMIAKLLQIGAPGRVRHATPQTELSVWTTQNYAETPHSGERITSRVNTQLVRQMEYQMLLVLVRDVIHYTNIVFGLGTCITVVIQVMSPCPLY